MSYTIAIDGPAGAGKSTIAKEIAKKKGCVYVDTGAMYRAMAIYFIDLNVDLQSEADVIAKLDGADVSISYEDGKQQVYLNGTNVTPRLREEKTGAAASVVSKYMPVRSKLVELQQKLATKEDVVMDGRDIGTAVLPNADVKVYLTASSQTRAQRRFDELVEKGETPDFEQLKKDIEDRDYQDMHREHSPLVQAKDAVLIDSSDMNIEQVVDAVLALCK